MNQNAKVWINQELMTPTLSFGAHMMTVDMDQAISASLDNKLLILEESKSLNVSTVKTLKDKP